MFRGALVYFVPCFFFGLLYGHLVSRSAKSWGRDVGRFYAVNTAGSCLGILFFTLVGYEIFHPLNAILIALGLGGVAVYFSSRNTGRLWLGRAAQGVVAIAAVAVLTNGLLHPVTKAQKTLRFWGRDGVVEVRSDGNLLIDGLQHSKLSIGQNHIGRAYSWLMVVAAYLAHGDRPLNDALVVGLGVGMTAATLSQIPGVEIDGYEINRTLERVMDRFPAESLQVKRNPRIHIIWQDARSGLALNPKKYDLILSAPLHLRQAGSSILLSREYLSLLKSRLKEGGVIALYAHEGVPGQAQLIRNTVASVFRHRETFLHGIILVASDSPIEIERDQVAARLQRAEPLYREVLQFEAQRGEGSLFQTLDSPRLPADPEGYKVSDDHPLIEYPKLVDELMGAS